MTDDTPAPAAVAESPADVSEQVELPPARRPEKLRAMARKLRDRSGANKTRTHSDIEAALPDDSLSREALMLAEAQSVLANDPAAALRLVGKFQKRFPQAQLAAEGEMIAIDALRRLGRYQEARHRAQQAIKSSPDGLYTDRVRGLLKRIPGQRKDNRGP